MDQKQQATTAASKPLGMCEKLFSAFQPGLRPLRRLTFRQQEATAAPPADSSPAQAHHGPIPQSKLPEPDAPPPPPPPQGKSKLPKVQHYPKPKHQEKPLATPVPPEAKVRPLVPVPQPPPPPPRPPPPKAEVHKPKKGINDRVDEYISRTRAKLRITSMKASQPAGDTPPS